MVQERAFVRMGVLSLSAAERFGRATKKGPFQAERDATARVGSMIDSIRARSLRSLGVCTEGSEAGAIINWDDCQSICPPVLPSARGSVPTGATLGERNLNLTSYGVLSFLVSFRLASPHLPRPPCLTDQNPIVPNMSKKGPQGVAQLVKLLVPAGKASAQPPVGPALGAKGVKAMDFARAL